MIREPCFCCVKISIFYSFLCGASNGLVSKITQNHHPFRGVVLTFGFLPEDVLLKPKTPTNFGTLVRKGHPFPEFSQKLTHFSHIGMFAMQTQIFWLRGGLVTKADHV